MEKQYFKRKAPDRDDQEISIGNKRLNLTQAKENKLNRDTKVGYLSLDGFEAGVKIRQT
jgi:hypothetical protein